MSGGRRHLVYIAHFITSDTITLRRLRQKLKQPFCAKVTFHAWPVCRFDHWQIDSDNDRNPAVGKGLGDHRNVRDRSSINDREAGINLALARGVIIDMRFNGSAGFVVEFYWAISNHRRDALFLLTHETELLGFGHLRI